MKKYEEKIDKLFEAVDPEQKLTDVKAQLKQAIAEEINQQASQNEKEAAMQAEQADEKNKQIVAQQQEQIENQKEQIEKQQKQIKNQEEQIKNQQVKLEMVQNAAIQNYEQQIQAAKTEQKEADDIEAEALTKQLIDAVNKDQELKTQQLAEQISDFIDTFIDAKTTLQVAINATALAEAHSEAFEKIKSVLFEKEMFEQGVQQKADDIIKHAQDEANKEIDDAIKSNQEKVELENKFNEAKSEISLLKAKIFLTEKTKYLRPTVARKICEQLDDKSFEEVEKEFEEVKAEAEADIDAQVKRVRQQKQNNGPKFDKSLNQEEEEDTATNQEETSVDMNESIKGSFAKAISTRIKKKL